MMIESQFIILKTGKYKGKIKHGCCFSSTGNQIAHKGKHHFTEIFQVISEKDLVESAYQPFAIPDVSVGLGPEHQQLLTSQKEMTGHHVPSEGKHATNCHLSESTGPASDQASGLAAIVQEM